MYHEFSANKYPLLLLLPDMAIWFPETDTTLHH